MAPILSSRRHSNSPVDAEWSRQTDRVTITTTGGGHLSHETQSHLSGETTPAGETTPGAQEPEGGAKHGNA